MEVTQALYSDVSLADLELLRRLMAEELHCEAVTWAHASLYQLAFYLFRLGQPEDVFLIYEAKYGTGHMDASCVMDREMLTLGHAPDEMLRYVEARFAAELNLREQYPELLERLRELKDDEEFSLAEYTRFIENYFADPDDESEP